MEQQPISNEELIFYCNDIKQGAIIDKIDTLKKIQGSLVLRADLPLDIIMQQDIIPNLVEGVKCNRPNIQLECLWILNNLATGNEEQTQAVMYSGVSPILLQQLESTKDKDYIPVILMCLGNLCGDTKCRNILLSNRLVSIVITVLNKYLLNQEIMESCLFCLRNSLQEMEYTQPFRKRELDTLLNLYKQLLNNKQIEINTSILSDILQVCLSVIERNSLTIGMTVMPVVKLAFSIMNEAVTNSFNQTEITVQDANRYPTKQLLEILGNILAENDEYCKYLLESNLLPFLYSVYYDQNNNDVLLKLEVLFCWMNIAGGKYSQVLFNSSNIQDLVNNVERLNSNSSDIDYEVARRSMVILCNFICECDDNTRIFFLSNGVERLLQNYLINTQNRIDEDHEFVVDMLRRMNG